MTAAEKLMIRADRYLASAAVLQSIGDFESAVSRSYYAMFYAARSALSLHEIEPRTHTGVVSEFGRVYVKTHRVDHEHLAALSQALNDRILAEYDEELTFSAQQAEEVRASAEVFVKVVRQFIDAPDT